MQIFTGENLSNESVNLNFLVVISQHFDGCFKQGDCIILYILSSCPTREGSILYLTKYYQKCHIHLKMAECTLVEIVIISALKFSRIMGCQDEDMGAVNGRSQIRIWRPETSSHSSSLIQTIKTLSISGEFPFYLFLKFDLIVLIFRQTYLK